MTTPPNLRYAQSTFTHLRGPASGLMRQPLKPEALQLGNSEMLLTLVAGMAAYFSVSCHHTKPQTPPYHVLTISRG